MTLRSDFARSRPEFPMLAAGDVDGISRFLSERGWLDPGESVLRCDRAGEGNMNLTLRVETGTRSFILKQARPWVEKYDDIAAPLERAQFERRFYERVQELAGVADRMPALLHSDPDACVLVLEDVCPPATAASGAGADLTSIYSGGRIDGDELDVLADYLRALHDGTRFTSPTDGEELLNLEMRRLNHEHLFIVPLAAANGLPLDDWAPGLADAARELRNDAAYRKLVSETADRYLAREGGIDAGACLLHGDYFPGSWLRTARGLRIIDPEFAFPGDPEVDAGCAAAHLALARQPLIDLQRFVARYESRGDRALDSMRLARHAAIEVMRRLIGVAQLPLPPDREGLRAALVRRSRQAMLAGDVELLFA